LAAVFWDGGAGTLNWSDAANWSSDALPGAADDVTINASGNETILISGLNAEINSLVTLDSVSLEDESSLVVAANSTIHTVLNNAGTVDVQVGTLNLAGGGTSSGTFQATSGTTLIFGSTLLYRLARRRRMPPSRWRFN
jgi:hypothetical protein